MFVFLLYYFCFNIDKMILHAAVYFLVNIFLEGGKTIWTAACSSQLHMDFPFPSVTKKPENSQGKLCKSVFCIQWL